jgi:RNA polymerase-binding transcription factor DksA
MTDNKETEKARLLARKQELVERITAIEQDYRKGLDADSEERAVQLENAEVLEGIGNAAADELAQIEERLAELG